MSFKIDFSNIDLDCPVRHLTWDVMICVVAKFTLCTDSGVLLLEERFPVVEFAVETASWPEALQGSSRLELIANSMECEEPVLVARPAGNGMWEVSSPFGATSRVAVVRSEVIARSLSSFAASLRVEVARTLRIDISPVVDRTGPARQL